MQKPLILVTGATGKTGPAVVDQLLAKDYPVRAAVRVHDARSEEPLRGAGPRSSSPTSSTPINSAVTRCAACSGPTTCRRSIPTPSRAPSPSRSRRGSPGLESIVQMGQWLSHRAHPALMTRQTWLMDQMFAQLPGITHTIINPGMFADNFLRVLDFAALLGLFPFLMGESRCAPGLQRGHRAHGRRRARRPGATRGQDPPADRAATPFGQGHGRQVATKVVGHRVMLVKLPFWMFRKVARQQRVDPYQIGVFRHYVEDNKSGAFEFEGGVTKVVEELTGTPAETFEATARRYAALPFARQTPGNRLRAFLNFNLTLFYPGYDLERLDRQLGFPVPPNPSLSMEDERWRQEHRRMMDAAATR